MLRALSITPGVSVAQRNHLIADRIIPDDPFFGNQWHHVQSGDHDIDSDLAWDITTGGITVFGDDIVACVIETGGTDWDHTDLLDNHWVNENEIPDNGVDDDDNGYVDDYDGWSLSNNSDQIAPGNHGTAVSSMIGSKGNNNTGVSGVNWNVKLMQVHMGGITEANVIEAYTYPLVMRKLYNQSGGAQGAFVVVTNASWGIDEGQPEDSPLWCAMYDSLGTYGVLNCGATANNNVNIDVVGDLPTACPSEYLISVTATNDEDVRTFSGYGITQIDLGAPGEDVYLASNTNNYSFTSGTSFASPCAAGAVALLYSADCISLNVLAEAYPEGAAALVRQYILNGVDAVVNLEDEVASGGRLNVNNSLMLLLSECSNNPCIAPFSITATQMEGTLDYEVSWGITESMDYFNLQYRVVGEPGWTSVNGLFNNIYTLNNLDACTEYEIQLQANCGEEESDWSPSLVFTTEGCCVNPGIESIEISFPSDTSIYVTWENVFAAIGYTIIVYDEDGNQLYNEEVVNSILISDLETCANYSIEVTTICDNGPLPPDDDIQFNTPGCGDCTDLEYCEITGGATLEWIAQVQLNTINNTTESDGGYGDYTGISTGLAAGSTYTLGLTPGYLGFAYSENFKAWIDSNSDGEFTEDEVVFVTEDGVNSFVQGDITIPINTAPGSVRLRVGMSYGFDPDPTPCGEIQFGETEDYCIDVLPVSISEFQISDFRFQIWPNPAVDELRVESNETVESIFIKDITGQIVFARNINSRSAQLDISALAAGLYVLELQSPNGLTGLLKLVIE